MDLSDAPPAPSVGRRPGPDVVRALAMAGVVTMNFHGYLILDGGRREGNWAYRLFDPWTGPLSTRFAATFVLTAGVGVTLLTRRATGDRPRTAALRWTLVRRGLLLYGFGLAFDTIWPGTILPFYGAMFVVAAGLFRLSWRWLVGIAAAAAIAAAAIRWWVYERQLDGHDTAWLTDPGPRSVRSLLFGVFVNGTHPLLPWLAFLSAGMLLGRVLDRSWWRPLTFAAGSLSFVAGSLASSAATGERSTVVLSNDPFERGLAYTASALGTALLAFAAITWVSDRFAGTPAVEALRKAGQMSLTIYLAHALVFNLLVDWLDVIEPAGLATSLGFAGAYWVAATALAIAYRERVGQGPAEWLYRRLSA